MRRKRRDTIEPRESSAAVDEEESNGRMHKEAEKGIDRWKDKRRVGGGETAAGGNLMPIVSRQKDQHRQQNRQNHWWLKERLTKYKTSYAFMERLHLLCREKVFFIIQ